MEGISVEQNLLMQIATFNGPVTLTGAEIGGTLDASGSAFLLAFNMDSLTVEQSLLLSSGANFRGEVVLVGAKIGGDLDLSSATFHQNLDVSNVVD